MHPFLRPHIRVRQQGQTLIIALIVLGVLLILGLVFLGLIDRNLRNAARGQRRSESSDLAEAGIRYAHGQLVSSLLGADWRGQPTDLGGGPTTGDPDAYYLRPASNVANVEDLGGPDRLGPFVRVNFPQGRSLVRVRYGASDASTAKLVPGGPLRNPGAARSTLIIEAIGRSGVVRTSDPTTLNAAGGLKFTSFANEAELTAGLAALAQADGQIATSRRLVAFAPIGIIDAARFETNVFNSSAPIPLGIDAALGIQAYDDTKGVGPTNVGTSLQLQLGTPGTAATVIKQAQFGNLPRGEGSFIANGDVALYGNVHLYMNQTLGDTFRVSGRVLDGDSNHPASLVLTPSVLSGNSYSTDTTNPTLTASGTGTGNVIGSFDSQSGFFNTAKGLVIDGSARTDKNGYPSGAGALVPPSAQAVDPQTKLNRYVAMTRESGEALGTGVQENSGAFGHGTGVYVDNGADRQEATDARGRQTEGSQRSLFDDWLNPNAISGSYWKGPFYTPPGAVVQFLADGFIVQRDAVAATERFWKDAKGNATSLATIRYRLGRGDDGLVHIIDTLTTTKDINGTFTTSDFDSAPPFNGVLYFEGNVRVRGTIPTEVQMSLVSGATIYIDGPITKGIVANEVSSGGLNPRFAGLAKGDPITGLPKASLMLMAKDNVAVNTTMFFGPTAGQNPTVVDDSTGATAISPVEIAAAGGDASRLELQADLGLDPNDPTTGNPLTNPSQWRPYALNYKSWDTANLANTNNLVPTQLLLTQTKDDSGPSATAAFLALDVNYGVGTSPYAFSNKAPDEDAYVDNLITNAADTYLYTATGAFPASLGLYGLGTESWQTRPLFETRSFPLLPAPNTANYSTANGGQISQGSYTLFAGANDLLVRPGAIAGVAQDDLLLGRVAVMPAEVTIEASVFAEQGSFFVIPGPWFNPQPNDTHDAFDTNMKANLGAGLSAAQARGRAERQRLEAFGTAPGAPFYGEPLDVRLSVVGSVAENLPPPISVQSEWVRKWGWIPRREGETGIGIPAAHVPAAPFDITKENFVPNLTIQYDPVLATGRVNDPNAPQLIRADGYGRPLPPMPRLPVSPKLSYFGEL